ncbi:DUF4864 domain-containing protein [Ramlibacter sp. XY19]|uniref:DUF4864 domain-containing protein n=1 Tax=Ramlibacter paludis TaxID=2908000 RepID=UPI0023DAF252|nr:DUF4864 domain-containing protein [Ramlibacter paludis]MCG2594102.1 DUF4864 domain-containing protein [Ramlibacter paludis]
MNEDFVGPFRRAPQPGRWHGAAAAWALLFALILGTAAMFASAAPKQHEVDPGVREVVQSQLQALASEDAGKAFALTDPALRTRFGSAEAFYATVREQYPMVVRPASVLFLKPESDGSIALQKVRLTDSDGFNWVVTYLLNRQTDHQWRISGTLVEREGVHVIV